MTPAPRQREQAGASSLTPEDLAELRRQLLYLRAMATGNVEFLTEDNLRPLRADDEDADSFDPDFALNVAGSAQNVVREIDDALRRMEAGTYGLCEASGHPIPKARLRAIPYARMTVEEQERQEREKSAGLWIPVEEAAGEESPAAEERQT
jgi:RNA polymerase-binding transcription factor DksA